MDTIKKLGAILASFVVCHFFLHILISRFSAKVFPWFNDLSLEKKISWNTWMVSTCHALVVGVLCLCSFLLNETFREDPVWGDLSLVTVTVAISTGHLISDLLLHASYWRAFRDPVFVIQDCAVLCAYYIRLFQMEGVLAYAGDFHLIRLLSTPFVNQLHFLDILDYSKFSEAYIISGVFTAVMFFLVRIVVIPWFYNFIYCIYGTDDYMRLGLPLQLFWIISLVAIDITNVIRMIKFIKILVNAAQYFHQREEATRNCHK